MTDRAITDGGHDDTPKEQPTRLTYEIGPAEPPSETVVRAVAAFTDTPLIELEPLYDTINPEYLNGCLQSINDDSVETELSFPFNECSVTVTPDKVTVRPQKPDS